MFFSVLEIFEPVRFLVYMDLVSGFYHVLKKRLTLKVKMSFQNILFSHVPSKMHRLTNLFIVHTTGIQNLPFQELILSKCFSLISSGKFRDVVQVLNFLNSKICNNQKQF